MSSFSKSPERTLLVMLRAGLYCLGASGLTGVLMMVSIEPFAPGDILPFIFWTLFFALGLALISPVGARLFSQLPLELPLPADEDVVLIYIQDQDGWCMDPPDAALLEQSLRLEANPNRLSQVIATIKVNGGTEGFGTIDWAFPTPIPIK